MSNDRETSEKKASEPLPVDPEERLDWDAYIPPPPPKRQWPVRIDPVNGTNGSDEAIATDELLIEEPKTLLRGEMHVRVIGGGRDRPIVVWDDDEICSE